MRSTAQVVALCLAGGLLALAQSGDIFERLRAALPQDGKGEATVAALRAKDFSGVEAALQQAEAAHENGPMRAELLALHGAVAFLSGDMRQAAAAFGESDKLGKLKEADRFTFAMAMVKLGDSAGARRVITDLVREHPGSALYWYWWGRLDYEDRRYGEAVEKLSRATGIDGKSARAWDGLGLAWDMQGQVEQARSALERAVNLNRELAKPSEWPPHNLGSLLLRSGDSKGAESALLESLRYNAAMGKTHYYLARVYEKQGREPEAIVEYQKAVDLDKEAPDACYALAMLYRKSGRHSEADAMFTEFKRRKVAGHSIQ